MAGNFYIIKENENQTIMKSVAPLFILCLLASQCAWAQEPSDASIIAESTVSYNNKVHDCWSASIDPSSEDVKKAWKDHLKKKYDTDVKGFGLFSKKDVLTSENASIPAISSVPVNLYFESIDEGTGSRIRLFGGGGPNNFWSSQQNEQEFQALKTILTQFLEEYLVGYHNNLVSEAQDKLNELNKEQENLVKNIQKNDEDILKMEQEIVKLRQENEKYARDLERNKSNMEQAQQLFQIRQGKAGEVKSKFKPSN